METALTKLLVVIVSIAIAGMMLGLLWTMWGSFASSHDFSISAPIIYDFGGNRRILVSVKNMGSVAITRIQVDPDNDGTYEISVSTTLKQGEECQVDRTFTDSVSYPKQTVAIRVTFQDGKTLTKLFEFPVTRA